MKFFNVAGPCNPQQHYMINAVERIKGVDLLIEQGQYFVIHAARQSGKTTFLLNMMKKVERRRKLLRALLFVGGASGH